MQELWNELVRLTWPEVAIVLSSLAWLVLWFKLMCEEMPPDVWRKQ